MNKGTRGKVIAVLVAIAAFVFVLRPAYGSYDATGGYVTLLGHNGGNAGESTFMTNIVRSNYGWSDMRDPHQFKLVEKVERYTYIQESIMLLTVAGYLAFAR